MSMQGHSKQYFGKLPVELTLKIFEHLGYFSQYPELRRIHKGTSQQIYLNYYWPLFRKQLIVQFSFFLSTEVFDALKINLPTYFPELLLKKCNQLRLFHSMHYAPSTWLPRLTELRLILMLGRLKAFEIYCKMYQPDMNATESLQPNLYAKALADLDPFALHFAAIGGNQTIINYFTQAGLSFSFCNVSGATPLMYAILFGHESLVMDQIKSDGSSLYQKDSNGASLYHYAAFGGHHTIMQRLEELGLETTQKDRLDHDAFYYATYGGYHKNLIKFEDIAQQNDRPTRTFSAIKKPLSPQACWVGGADLTSSGIDATHPLLNETELFDWLSRSLTPRTFRALKATPFIDLYLQTPHWENALLAPASNNNFEIFKYIFDKVKTKFSDDLQALLSIKDSYGKSPIHFFAASNGWAGIELYYELFGNKIFDITDNLNMTILQRAARGGNLTLLKWCIEKQYNIKQSSDLKKLISLQNPNQQNLLHDSAFAHNPDCLAYCIQLGFPRSQVDKYGKTALDLALGFGSLSTVHFLLANQKLQPRDRDLVFLSPQPEKIHYILHHYKKLPLSRETFITFFKRSSESPLTTFDETANQYMVNLRKIQDSLNYLEETLVKHHRRYPVDPKIVSKLIENLKNSLYNDLRHSTSYHQFFQSILAEYQQFLNKKSSKSKRPKLFKPLKSGQPDRFLENLNNLKLIDSLGIFATPESLPATPCFTPPLSGKRPEKLLKYNTEVAPLKHKLVPRKAGPSV